MHFNSSTNSRGVAVLIRNNLEHEILECAADPQENALLLKMKIKGKELILGTVYGPNDNVCENLFKFLRGNLTRLAGILCVIGGDWNATPSYAPVDINPDVIFMRSIPSRIKSEHVETMCADCDLSDPFRTLNQDLKEFSYYPSCQLRKNRSRIDFFLVSSDIYEFVESCNIAQSFCNKAFDHKPIFLTMKKRKGKGRICIYDSTINHPLSTDVIKCACYRVTIEEAAMVAGPLTEQILHGELVKIEVIEDIIKNICTVKGISCARDWIEEEDGRLAQLEDELTHVWTTVADLQYLQTFTRQVDPDVFFKKLLSSCKSSMLRLQNLAKYVESAVKKNWTAELVRLKRTNYAANFETITQLENLLNAASEKFVRDRLSNYVKSEVLNLEKMTPKFLKIAEKNVEISLATIKDEDGNPFATNEDRHEHIVKFYEKLYKNPVDMPNDFSNCVEEFLGDLAEHPVIMDCKLNDDDRLRLDAPLTTAELDTALSKCNMRSAPVLTESTIDLFGNFGRFLENR
jgi:exonuclease III